MIPRIFNPGIYAPKVAFVPRATLPWAVCGSAASDSSEQKLPLEIASARRSRDR